MPYLVTAPEESYVEQVTTPGPTKLDISAVELSADEEETVGWFENTSSSADRRLLHQYEELKTEINRLRRRVSIVESDRDTVVSEDDDYADEDDAGEFHRVREEIARSRKESRALLEEQTELLDEMNQQERSSMARFFNLSFDTHSNDNKAALAESLSKSLTVDANLQDLERRAAWLQEDRSALAPLGSAGSQTFPAFTAVRTDHNGRDRCRSVGVIRERSLSNRQLLSELEREKEGIVHACLRSRHAVPETQSLTSALEMHSAELRSCDNIAKQVKVVRSNYLRAVQLLRQASLMILSSDYDHSLRSFIKIIYPAVVEAAQVVHTAANLLQPEARRKYRDWGPRMKVQLPKFPSIITELTKRSRVKVAARSTVAMEASKKLPQAEQTVLQCLESVLRVVQESDRWHEAVLKDSAVAAQNKQKTEALLHEKLAVAVRANSV